MKKKPKTKPKAKGPRIHVNLIIDPAQLGPPDPKPDDSPFVVETSKELPRIGPKGIGPAIHNLKVGQCVVCKPGIPLRPHQTVYYYNRIRKGEMRWVCSCDNGVYRIHRVK